MKCKPSKYAVVNGGNVTYGFRCAQCGEPSKRYSTQALRDERLKEHRKLAKKRAKKS